jgi:DNA-binding HxlR family transcriptional regulator
VLNRRLAELREAAIVELAEEGYRLTPDGGELLALIAPVSAWATRWARRIDRRIGAT